MLGPMDDLRFGGVIRTLRVRRRWRQEDLAARAGVSRSWVSLVGRGHLDAVTVRDLRKVCGALDVRVELVPRWRGGDLDRVVNARHAALHEAVGEFLA